MDIDITLHRLLVQWLYARYSINRFVLQYLRIFSLTLFFIISFGGSIALCQPSEVIHHKTQFRGVWIATVRNLDWPSEPGLSVRRMKKEFVKQLDMLRELGMNAVIVQIRPVGDALYPSRLEPWSEFLTGVQGKAPPGSFDPLTFMIEETHKRCMEFHAWFNPYRGIRNMKSAVISKDHVYYQHPEWFVQYGDHVYFDPGMTPARIFVENVIADVVTRYDIDAVHFDDYYYPYRIEGQEFPDSMSFSLYGNDFPTDKKEDWRRENINLLVSELFDTINQIKPWVHFGISPFGVWRNKSRDPRGSETETLQTNYDDLFGDALTWLSNGWLDYIVPQCYQFMGRKIMDYRIVTRWWNDNQFGVNYYIGQGPFRLGSGDRGAQWTEGNEIDRQMQFNDSIPNLLGSVFFRSLTFQENPLGVNDSLRTKYYRYPALAPPSHHDTGRKNDIHITGVKRKIRPGKVKLKWETDATEKVRYFVIYRSSNSELAENILAITSKSRISISRKIDFDPDELFISAVNIYRIEGNVFSVLVD